MSQSERRLVVSGSVALDLLVSSKQKYTDLLKPKTKHTDGTESDEVVSISVFADTLRYSQGGTGANIAYTNALLGGRPILLGSVGKDANAYLTNLQKHGIDTSHVHISADLPTSFFGVLTDADNGQIGFFFPGAMSDPKANLSVLLAINTQSLVVISPHDPQKMHQQIRECAEYELPMVFDIGQQVVNADTEMIRDGVQAAEILMLNNYEFRLLCDKLSMTPEQVQNQVPIVVITHGKNGVEVFDSRRSEHFRVPAARPHEVVDPTGAGDAFRGGFLRGYLLGFDLQTCAQMGAVAAVYCVERHGTQEHYYTIADFQERYQENFGLPITLQG